MTKAETAAFNAGLLTAASLARRCANAMRSREKLAPTRYPFATAALDAVADEAAALVLPLPPDGSEPAATRLPMPIARLSA